MRNLDSVINELLAVIPESSEKLRDELEYVMYNIGYTAPEMMIVRWNEVHSILVDNLPEDPAEDWQWKAFSIFSTRPVDELKEIWQGERK